MIVLSSTTDSLQALLGGAVTTNELQCVASWRDITTTAYTPGRTVGLTSGATPVAVVAAPAASTQRVVDFVSIYNSDTVVTTVTVRLNDNGTTYVLWSGTLLVGQSVTFVEGAGWVLSEVTQSGVALHVQALTSSPTDAQTVYFGSLPKAPVTAAATSKVYVPRAGVIRRAEVYCYSGTAGTAEGWSLYVRLNNATDYLIATVSASASERRFFNASLAIPVSVGDYVEIKGVQPTWATNPLTTIYGGYVYLE